MDLYKAVSKAFTSKAYKFWYKVFILSVSLRQALTSSNANGFTVSSAKFLLKARISYFSTRYLLSPKRYSKAFTVFCVRISSRLYPWILKSSSSKVSYLRTTCSTMSAFFMANFCLTGQAAAYTSYWSSGVPCELILSKISGRLFSSPVYTITGIMVLAILSYKSWRSSKNILITSISCSIGSNPAENSSAICFATEKYCRFLKVFCSLMKAVRIPRILVYSSFSSDWWTNFNTLQQNSSEMLSS